MSTPNKQNIQDEFLETLKRENTRVSIYLASGIHLTGCIAGYDRHMILLGSPSGTQMIYKHGISTVLPAVRANSMPDPVSTPGNEARVEERRGDSGRVVTIRKKRVFSPSTG